MSIVPGSDQSSDARDQLNNTKSNDEPASAQPTTSVPTENAPIAPTVPLSGDAPAAGAAVEGSAGSMQPTAPVQQPGQNTTTTTVQNNTSDAVNPASPTSSPDASKAAKAKLPRQPGSAAKPKQKRKANQAGAKNADPVHTGPSTAGGTIGAAPDHAVPAVLTAGGGGRKPLPELVLPFKLPCTSVKPEFPLLDNATDEEKQAYCKASKLNDGSKKAGQETPKAVARKPSPAKGIKSRSRQITGAGEEVSESELESSSSESDSDEDEEEKQQRRDERKRKREPASIEDSLVMLQSLRQSRLSHLSSLLPPFSQKVRSGMIYPNVLPLSLLQGLNPREPHVLIQLGRADIQVGPHVFVKTKFWEVRPDYETSSSTPSTRPGGITSGPFGETKGEQKLEAKQEYSQPTAEQLKASAPAASAQSRPPTSATTPQPIAPRPPAPTAAVPPPQPVTKSAQATTPATQPASTSTTFTQVSLPRPPIVQPTASTTPSLPKPPTLTPTSQQGTTSSTTVSQHVQFAPARLSPISQPSQQQGTSTSTSTPPPRPIQPIPATSATSTSSVPAPASTANAATPAASAVRSVPPPRQLQPTPVQARPPAPPAQPAIDSVLVSRVNATAALNPELQQLLHVAASGKANPEQLKSLGVWIQAITAQLREDEAKAAAAGRGKEGQTGNDASGSGSPAKKGRKKKGEMDPNAKAAKKAAKAEEKEAKKKAAAAAKAEAKGFFSSQRQPGVRPHNPPPGWPTDGPPRPPVIVVEFRENPSMRFVLPLWKCIAERKEGVDPASMPKIKKERGFFDGFDADDAEEEEKGVEPELKLSFFVPAIGSDAAGKSGVKEILEEEQKAKAEEEAKKQAQGGPTAAATAPSTSSAAAPAAGTGDGDAAGQSGDASATGQKKLSKKAQKALEETAASKVPAEIEEIDLPKKHEQFPATWTIKGGMTESMWEAFGRIPGCITNAVVRPVKVEPEIELAPDVAEFLVPEIKYHLLDLPEEDIKIHKETASTFVDLFNQLPDRHYVFPCIAPMQVPLGLEEHLADKFSVRPQAVSARPVAKRKAGARDDGDFSFGFDGISVRPGDLKGDAADTPPKPPKRKRHVATHNPDGSIKSCGACGKTKTPMWRRGPKGPSQLCNACGARWKAGRLVVPEVAPPPIIETEADRIKEEKEKQAKLQAKQAAQAASNGNSNGNGLSSTAGTVFIPMTPSSGAITMGSTTFGSMDMSHSPSAFNAQAHTSMSMPSSGSYHLVGMDNGMDFDSMSMGMTGMEHGHMPGSTRPSPSPFIRSPNPHERESMPASVDPSVLFGGSNSSRSSSH